MELSRVQPIGGVGASGQLPACYRPSALTRGFFRDTDAGRWSAPARSCRGCLFTLGITAPRPRERSADGIFDGRSPRTRRPAGSRTSGGHLLLVVNPVRGPLASPFFFTGARNELQSPPSIDRDGGPRTRSKDNAVQNGLRRLGNNRFQGWSRCSCGRQCNDRGQSGSFDHGTHGTRPSWGCTKIRLSPTQRSCNGDNSATSCKKNCSFAQYRGNTSPRLLGPMVRAREHFARL